MPHLTFLSTISQSPGKLNSINILIGIKQTNIGIRNAGKILQNMGRSDFGTT